MKTKSKHLIVLAILVVLASAFFTWRYQAVQAAGPPPQFAIVLDSSGSTLSPCPSLLGLTTLVFDNKKISDGSSLSVLLTGDKKTANEPKLFSSFKIPVSTQIMEGGRQAQKEKNNLLNDLNDKCQQLQKTNTTAVFLGIKRALEIVQFKGCDGGISPCQIFIQTDGEENAEKWIKHALKGKKSNTSPPPKINNQGIDIIFCGQSETVGQTSKHKQITKSRSASQVVRQQQVWLSLFTHPKQVQFLPFCPKAKKPTPTQAKTE